MSDRKLSEATKKNVAYSQRWTCNICQILLPPTYQVDHIVPHAILADDSPDNLQALCPNCHSLTPNYKALNKGNGNRKRHEYFGLR